MSSKEPYQRQAETTNKISLSLNWNYKREEWKISAGVHNGLSFQKPDSVRDALASLPLYVIFSTLFSLEIPFLEAKVTYWSS
jgi:hypothetical protein